MQFGRFEYWGLTSDSNSHTRLTREACLPPPVRKSVSNSCQRGVALAHAEQSSAYDSINVIYWNLIQAIRDSSDLF